MNDLRDEARALGRDFLAIICIFVLSFAAAFALGLYLLLRYAIQEQGWWSIIHAVQVLIELPVLIAMGSTAVMLFLALWLRHGLWSDGRWLVLEVPGRRRSPWRHYRRQFPLALKIFLLLLLISTVIMRYSPAAGRPDPYAL